MINVAQDILHYHAGIVTQLRTQIHETPVFKDRVCVREALTLRVRGNYTQITSTVICKEQRIQ